MIQLFIRDTYCKNDNSFSHLKQRPFVLKHLLLKYILVALLIALVFISQQQTYKRPQEKLAKFSSVDIKSQYVLGNMSLFYYNFITCLYIHSVPFALLFTLLPSHFLWPVLVKLRCLPFSGVTVSQKCQGRLSPFFLFENSQMK